MTKNKKLKWFEFIEANTKEADISYRGGTIKIDVSELFDTGEEDAVMGAYQNYLGGGIAGRIMVGRQFDIDNFNDKNRKVYEELTEALKMYFYEQNQGGGDEYMVENVNNYGHNQKLPVSGF